MFDSDNQELQSDIHLVIRERTRQEIETTRDCKLAAETFLEVSPETSHEQIFQRLQRQLVQLNEVDRKWSYRGEDGSLIPYPELRSDFFPDGFEEEVKGWIRIASDRTARFVTVFAWRLNEPFFSLSDFPLSADFSFDKHQWYPMPRNNGPSVSASPIQPSYVASPLPEKIHKDISRLLGELIDEGAPVYHALFSEAISQRSKNPKSALIMGTVALEAAVKQCISTLVPHTDWLLDSIQSPPVFKILRDYIPELPVKSSHRAAIPKSLLTTVQRGIEARNKIIHTGKIPRGSKNLDSYYRNIGSATFYFLHAVQDLIWILDYYQGRSWALDYVKKSTLEDMGLEGRGVTYGLF